ncbi:Aflatoxin biosynthesis regulatory protein [Penicillium expansum]|uniref:Aflatoxin biosynthesis regulatory protein n=1 Tax=Penicillium expansum TaxID=27334 RepID=A0A0A2KGV0_PENEN|nr:Aflatoxin biosynthesis regulatory protein [Penicillium expansum]KGO60276.1 Aflatoxin biosynthesis regulatory protein [Penicillium expansum]KGO66121.1 Aflatoxin biosynthesis regulatory protein [Penicillium expansum]
MRRVKKSRNGCARCKSKRVKCGEEKPHCTRCTRLGVHCPGYAQSLRWVTEYEQSSPAVPGSISEVRTPSPAASTAPSQLANQIDDALPDESNFESAHEPGPSNFVLDGRTALCDNLWEHPGHGSLPELTDLCSPSPMAAASSSFSHQRDDFHDFEQSDDLGVDLSHFLSLIGPTPNEEEVDNVYRDFSPSAIVRSYPPASHRPVPHNFMSMSRSLNNPSWTLIEYYFKEVAALFSSYDSQMNPFRTTVSRLWGSSLAMCRTMQSMAAATLVTEFPQFGPMGRRMRDEAVEIITREAVIDDKSLLALLMLGQTASWHDPKDLGISFFNLLRKQLNTLASSSHNPSSSFPQNDSNNYRFFEEALIYWEMLLSFVADNDTMVLSNNLRTASSMGESFVLQRVPHPWTGIARDTQFTVHEVGQLIRRERKRIYSRRFTSQDDITRAQLAIEKARELEKRLLGLAHPSEAEIVSPGDDDTPVWHLLTMAEAYRCVGLMQLYRVFPDLLHKRLPSATSTSPQYPSNNDPTSRDPFFPVDLDSMNLSAGFGDPSPATGKTTNSQHNVPSPSTKSSPHNPYQHSPHNLPSPPSQDTQQPPTPETLYSNWLTDFAVTTLSRLKTIPLESRTRCLQPFLLVASCSELRLARLATNVGTQSRSGEDFAEGANDSNNPNQTPTISMEAIEVSRTRKFILGRLTSFLHVLPPKPIHVCLKLVNEVWKRLDAGDDDTYWVDVMIEKGWETTMG